MARQRTAMSVSVSTVATYGSVLLVGANFFYRISNRQWASVAVIAAIAAVVLLGYVRVVPLGDLNDDETQSGAS